MDGTSSETLKGSPLERLRQMEEASRDERRKIHALDGLFSSREEKEDFFQTIGADGDIEDMEQSFLL